LATRIVMPEVNGVRLVLSTGTHKKYFDTPCSVGDRHHQFKLEGKTGPRQVLDGRHKTTFCSNNNGFLVLLTLLLIIITMYIFM